MSVVVLKMWAIMGENGAVLGPVREQLASPTRSVCRS